MSRDFLWGKGMTKPAKLPVTGQVTGKAVVDKINEVIEQSLGKDETAVDSERLAGKTLADLMAAFTAESTETANTLVSAHETKPDPHPQYATDTELSALSQSLSGSVQSAISIAQSKVATVNGLGPDAGGNVTLPVPDSGGARLVHSYTGNAQIDLYGNWGAGLYIAWTSNTGTASISVTPHNSEIASVSSNTTSTHGAGRYFKAVYTYTNVYIYKVY
jgi:reverse gyrase